MQEYEKVFLEDKNKILKCNDIERKKELIKAYNRELSLMIPFMSRPLPKECELDNDLISEEYKEFKEYFKEVGFYTISKHIKDADLIVEVKIINDTLIEGTSTEKVSAEIVKLHKGNKKDKEINFYIDDPFLPICFKKNDYSLIFLKKDNFEHNLGKYFTNATYGTSNNMKIINENNSLYVLCDVNDIEFWEDNEFQIIEEGYWGYSTKIKYNSMIEIIKRYNKD